MTELSEIIMLRTKLAEAERQRDNALSNAKAAVLWLIDLGVPAHTFGSDAEIAKLRAAEMAR